MTLRFLRSLLLACLVALLWAVAPPLARVVHAEGPRGWCDSSAHADASSYDGTLSGSWDGSISVSDYTLSDCVGLSQNHAIFIAGGACQRAGIPAGVEHGLGYAIVTWSAFWRNMTTGEVTYIGPIQQQYDCGDTFS